MASLVPILCLALCLANRVMGHYVFAKLRVNGFLSDDYEYIRNITESWAYDPTGAVDQYNPYYDIYDDNIRCGRGAATSGPGVKTATVVAGENVTFVVTRDGSTTLPTIYHAGPGQAYLSPVGDDQSLEEYQGDGEWFKVGYIGAMSKTRWELLGKNEMTFTIPRSTPPGKYLMRAEHIFAFSSRFNDTQFYLACAHLDIVGPGGGTPGPLVKFPGAYDLFDAAMWQVYEITSNPIKDLSKYIAPGPPVWEG